MTHPPDFTTVVALDANHLDELRAVWPTWLRYRPELLARPLLLICDDSHPIAWWQDALSFLNHPSRRLESWTHAAADQREKMLAAFVYGVGRWVETPWYLKLDTDVAAVCEGDWLNESWFAPDDQGRLPVFVSSPWGYTKPAEMIGKMDQWASGVDELAQLPPLGLFPQVDSAIIRHPRIISWCFFGHTDWTRRMSEYSPSRLPVASQDTFLWYCAKRRGDFFRTTRMRKVGWAHVSHRRKLLKLCRSILKSHDRRAVATTTGNAPEVRLKGHTKSLVRLLADAQIDPLHGAEIGVYRGSNARALLARYPNLKLSLVDTWAPPQADSPYLCSGDSAAKLSLAEQQANYEETLAGTDFAGERRRVYRTRSSDAATQTADSSLDFAFIDADHTYEGCSADIVAWWPKIRPGGVLSGHDYRALLDRRGRWGVSRAVDEFARRHNLEVRAWPRHVWEVRKPRSSSKSTSLSVANTDRKSTPPIVRVLFGDLDAYPKLRREVVASAQHEWSRRSAVHFVLGRRNYDFLKGLGIEDLRLVDEREEIVTSDMPKLANKPLLLRHAMEQFDEILFLDFDCQILKAPDVALWDALRGDAHSESKSFQALNVQYRRRILPHMARHVSRRRCVNTSVVYCSRKAWIDRWIDAFRELKERGFVFYRNSNDEVALMYSLYSHCGFIGSEDMVKTFETPIAKLKRGIPEAQASKRTETLYFKHF